MAAWTEGVTTDLCDYKMKCATENILRYNVSTAAASVVRNAAAASDVVDKESMYYRRVINI